ncbi:MAG TPA: hypothetical protein VGU20_23600 [Stellaceae bacterium]|nr:hypothetical protein [Stellaceae bacterium]
MIAKLVHLNDVPVGQASTWFEVAEIVSRLVGATFTAKGIQRHASEGPRGFYVTLRRDEIEAE